MSMRLPGDDDLDNGEELHINPAGKRNPKETPDQHHSSPTLHLRPTCLPYLPTYLLLLDLAFTPSHYPAPLSPPLAEIDNIQTGSAQYSASLK